MITSVHLLDFSPKTYKLSVTYSDKQAETIQKKKGKAI